MDTKSSRITQKDRNECFLNLPLSYQGTIQARHMIVKGVDVNVAKDNGDTKLTQAVKAQHMGMIETLIDCGARVNKANLNDTPLTIACQNDSEEILLKLIKHGANLNMYHPLGVSINAGRFNFAKILIDRGADINKGNGDGASALMLMAARGRKALTNAYKSRVEVPNLYTDPNFIDKKMREETEFVQYLIEKGANVNALDRYNSHALLYATVSGQVSTLEVLLDHSRSTISKESLITLRSFAIDTSHKNENDSQVCESLIEKALLDLSAAQSLIKDSHAGAFINPPSRARI